MALACCKRRKLDNLAFSRHGALPPGGAGDEWIHRLVLTDVRLARGVQRFEDNVVICRNKGVTIVQEEVSCFNYMHSLKTCTGMHDRVTQEGFDVVVTFGINYGVFHEDGTLDYGGHHGSNAFAKNQYEHLDRQEQQRTEHEALLGQDPYTTNIMIHAENHSRYCLSSSSFSYLRCRLFNPMGLQIATGWRNEESRIPLVCTVTGPSLTQVAQYLVTTAHGEEQLDAIALIHDTLRADGSVLGLGVGCLEFWKHVVLATAAPAFGGRGIRRPHSWSTPGRRGKIITEGTAVSYHGHCVGSDGTSGVVGRIDYAKVREWVASEKPCWVPDGI